MERAPRRSTLAGKEEAPRAAGPLRCVLPRGAEIRSRQTRPRPSAKPVERMANCGRACTATVGVEQERAGGAIVDDPIVGASVAAAPEPKTRTCRQRAGCQPGEHRIVELDGALVHAVTERRCRSTLPPRSAVVNAVCRPRRRAQPAGRCRRSPPSSTPAPALPYDQVSQIALPVRSIAAVPPILVEA